MCNLRSSSLIDAGLTDSKILVALFHQPGDRFLPERYSILFKLAIIGKGVDLPIPKDLEGMPVLMCDPSRQVVCICLAILIPDTDNRVEDWLVDEVYRSSGFFPEHIHDGSPTLLEQHHPSRDGVLVAQVADHPVSYRTVELPFCLAHDFSFTPGYRLGTPLQNQPVVLGAL